MIRALVMAPILCLLLAADAAAADPRCADGESGDACRRTLAVPRNNAIRSKADTNDIRTIQGPALLRKEGQPKLDALVDDLEASFADDD